MVRKISEMRQNEWCDCGGAAEKIIVPTQIAPDTEGYECPVTGKWIEGRYQHKENLKRTGCRVYEEGETKDFIKNKEQRQKDFDRRTENIVEKAARDIGLIR